MADLPATCLRTPLPAVAPSDAARVLSTTSASARSTALDTRKAVRRPPPTPQHENPTPHPQAKPARARRPYIVAREALAMRDAGMQWDDIAKELDLAVQTVRQYITYAARQGWINSSQLTNADDHLEHILQRKVTQKLEAVLDETPDEPAPVTNRAIEVSLEIAKGRGLFKQHQVVKGEQTSNAQMTLKVQVDMPPVPVGGTVPQIREGSLAGTPAFDGDIIDVPVTES